MDDVSTPDAPRSSFSCWKSDESMQQEVTAIHERAAAKCGVCKDDSAVWQCKCTRHHPQQQQTKQWLVCDEKDCIGVSKKRHLKKFSVPADLVKMTESTSPSSLNSEAGCTLPTQVTRLTMVKDRDVCLTHHEPLKRFCIECQEPACLECLIDGEHRHKQSDLQHKNKPIEEAALEKVKELKSLSEELASKERYVKSTIDTVQRSEVILSVVNSVPHSPPFSLSPSHNHESTKQAISEVVSTQEKAVKLIMKKSEQLINQITLESLSKGKELSRQKELLECHLQTIEKEQEIIERVIEIGTNSTTTDNHKVVRVFPRLKSQARCAIDAPIVLGEPCLV
ncbi:hypothetical protein Pelo_18521 [Pelomyxa schiedti]|nr:hypothetical protein Pelo_18521 [Pelomyxa schiedti]